MNLRFTERLYLFACTFRVSSVVDGLPFYAGPHWSALFRNLYKHIHGRSMPEKISVIPLESGTRYLDVGMNLSVLITCPDEEWNNLREVLRRFNEAEPETDGHLLPGRTLMFSDCHCRTTGNDILTEGPAALAEEHLEEELSIIKDMGSLTLYFYTPLRLTRPAGMKTEGHRYLDSEFLLSSRDTSVVVMHFLHSIRSIETGDIEGVEDTSIVPGPLYWIDTPYRSNTKTLGGIFGRVVIRNLPDGAKLHLIAGQYTGMGKNRGFGFGYYLIEESARGARIMPPERFQNPLDSAGFNLERPFTSLRIREIKNLCSGNPGIKVVGNPLLNSSRLDEQYGKADKEEQGLLLRSLLPLSRLPDHSLSAACTDISSKRPLFLTRFTRKIHTEGPNLMVEIGSKLKVRVPWSTINHIFLIGKPPVTTGILYRAMSDRIPVTFMDMTGRTRGNLYPEDHEMPYYSTIQQERMNSPAFCLDFARQVVHAKIHNSGVILRRNGVDVSDLMKITRSIHRAPDLDSLRGHEGMASRLYFEKFSALVESFDFVTRDYHPPHDPVNAMLSFCYSLLHNRIASLLRTRGLNPRLGLYHQGRGRHAALASDLMEELRHLAERVVLKVIHRAEVQPDEFTLRKWRQQTVCEIPRHVITLLVERFEEIMHTEAVMYGNTDVYGYMHRMINSFLKFLKDGTLYKPLMIR